MPTLHKFSDPLPKTHLFFNLALESTVFIQAGIFLGCLRGRYKAPVPMANIHIFSQFEQKNSQSEGQLYVNQ